MRVVMIIGLAVLAAIILEFIWFHLRQRHDRQEIERLVEEYGCIGIQIDPGKDFKKGDDITLHLKGKDLTYTVVLYFPDSGWMLVRATAAREKTT